MSVSQCSSASAAPAAQDEMSGRLTALFALAVGVIVVNLFAPQTLTGLIGPSLGFGAGAAGLVATATLLGYAAGLFLLVPLADLLENRRLVLRLLACAVVAAALAPFAPSVPVLLAVLFILGAACSAIQILVPVAAHMAPAERRGRVIGDVMGGLMVGILLSRPLASFLAAGFGWRAFYGASAAAMALLTLMLALRLPRIRPAARASYGALIASLWHLLRTEPVLQRKALTASLGMGAFSLFWTAVALRLAQPPFSLGQNGIALFALAGAGGAVATPLFGRLGDGRRARSALLVSDALLPVALALMAWAGCADLPRATALALLVAGAVLLDVGLIGNQTLGRRAINLLNAEARGRINGLFVGLFFIGGAVGSALAGMAWAFGGWLAVCAAAGAFALPLLAVDLCTD